ncbi:MAG: hypothetical protein ACI4LN_01350 [Anaerovoracaceae bacterium]
MAIGEILLIRLAINFCGSWRNFIVAIGDKFLWQLAVGEVNWKFSKVKYKIKMQYILDISANAIYTVHYEAGNKGDRT